MLGLRRMSVAFVLVFPFIDPWVATRAKEEATKLAKASDFEAKRREHYRKQEGEVIRLAKKKNKIQK